jgi:hypothetical protein
VQWEWVSSARRRHSRATALAALSTVALALVAASAAVAATAGSTAATAWQYAATDEQAVPSGALVAAHAITIGIIDTGADLSAPSLAARHPATYDVATGSTKVSDFDGHGTFVASLVGAFGGDARLLIVRATAASGQLGDVDAAEGIVYAVDHGARIVNLSFSGSTVASPVRAAVAFAMRHGALVVAAAGNAYGMGNPTQYPAALLGAGGSAVDGGAGLAVAASDTSGQRAPFSSTGSYVSLAAPGVDVVGAVSALSSPLAFPRTPQPGLAGLYGLGSGSSFAAAEVSGAAALVWAAAPALPASAVVRILEQTASGGGSWNPELGYGVVDVGSAVAVAEADNTARTALGVLHP